MCNDEDKTSGCCHQHHQLEVLFLVLAPSHSLFIVKKNVSDVSQREKTQCNVNSALTANKKYSTTFYCAPLIHCDKRLVPLGFILKLEQIGAFEYNDATNM